MSYENAFDQYRRGIAPKKNDWALCDPEDGWTIAHTAASENRLPAVFNGWDLVDNDGRSVAHIYAANAVLPVVFNYWYLVDNRGDTVAHVAAANNKLPPGFENWALVDKVGNSVAHRAVIYNSLPRDFKNWGLKDSLGNTVAHLAASLDRLPATCITKDILSMVNNAGESVESILNERRETIMAVEKERVRKRDQERFGAALNMLKNPPRAKR